MKLMRCDYCGNYGHHSGNCPHMGKHLLDPDPKFNSLRNFVAFVDAKLEPYGKQIGESSIEAFERQDKSS